MPVTLSIIISKKSIILVYNFGIIDSTSSFRHTGLCHYTVVTQISLEWSHYVTTYAPKSEKCPVQYYWDSTALLVHPSRAQTSERIHDLDHSEGDVYASFKWDLCSERMMTKSGIPKACSTWQERNNRQKSIILIYYGDNRHRRSGPK